MTWGLRTWQLCEDGRRKRRTEVSRQENTVAKEGGEKKFFVFGREMTRRFFCVALKKGCDFLQA